MDKFMLTREEIEQFIETSRQHRFDANINTDTLQANIENEALVIKGTVQGHADQKLSFSQSAMSQLLNKLRIPAEFFGRCPKELEQQIFNHFVGQEKESYFCRMNPNQDKEVLYAAGGTMPCRAVLTNKYGIVDDYQLFPVVFSALDESVEQKSYRRMRTDDRITQMYIDFPDCTTTYNDVIYTAGVMITNSETGHSSVWIEPVVSSSVITYQNRAILQKQGVKCRLVHRGVPKLAEVREMIIRAKDIAQVGLLQLVEATQQTVSKDFALAYAKSIEAMPKRIFDILEEEWEEAQDLTREHIARRIIQLAAELPLFQRITVEQAACGVTKIFDNFQARMMEIAQAMADGEE